MNASPRVESRPASIRWDFRRAAAAIVASQRRNHRPRRDPPAKYERKHHDTDDDAASDDGGCGEDEPLIELNHWTVERSLHPATARGADGDGGEVYLAHPPVVMTSCRGSTLDDDVVGVSSGDLVEEAALIEEFDVNTLEEDVESAVAVDCSRQAPPSSDAAGTTDGGTVSDCNCRSHYTEWSFTVVYHETWKVPTLYFTAAHPDGTPLRRSEVLDVLLDNSRNEVHPRDETDAEGAGCDGVSGGDGTEGRDEEELWEFVSQEEHPMTGRPAYFLHPCRTADRMELMLAPSLALPSADADCAANCSDKNGKEGTGLKAEGAGVKRAQQGVCCPLLSWMSMVLPVVGCKVSSDMFCQLRGEMR